MTIWDGVYTEQQALRGEQAAWRSCFSCHSVPEWSSDVFLDSSESWRLGNLFNIIRQSMPYDAPASLSDEVYVDIVAYILELRGAPPGGSELPPRLRALDQILVTPR